MEISIVSTLYYSAPYLLEFYNRIRNEVEKITQDFEIILVNDGSPDDVLDIAISIQKDDKRIRIIDLSRNYGHHKAMMTGLTHSSGALVFLIDCDLEEAPELLGIFLKKMQLTNADVIYGVQEERKGKFIERTTGYLFYKLFNFFSTYPIPPNIVTARLMKRDYVNGLVRHRDQEIFIAGLWAITGFDQVPEKIVKHSRDNSSYNLIKRVSIFTNSITSFSNRPLVFIFYLGLGISFVSFIAALYLVIRRIFFGEYLSGWPSLIISIWLLGGLTIFSLGIIGIYLSKVFIETKRRPYTIIKKIYGKDDFQ